MPQWASAEGAGSEAASPEQMIYYEDDTSEYFDNKQETDIKIEQAGGKSCPLFLRKKTRQPCVRVN